MSREDPIDPAGRPSVDIFMLDGRTHRYPERWPDGADKALRNP